MKKIIILLSFFLLLYTPYIVEAENDNSIISEIEAPQGYDIEKVTEDVTKGVFPVSFSQLIEKVLTLFLDGVRENMPHVIKLIVLCMLSGIVINLDKTTNDIATLGAVAILATVSIKVFSYIVVLIQETIDSLFLFISGIMAPLATVTAASGVMMGTAAATTFVAMQVFIHICKTVFIPLVCVVTALSVSDKIGKTPYLLGVSSVLKQILKWGTGFMITVYSVVIGLQAQTAANLDTLAGKSLKYAVASFVPVVGGVLSESLETVIAGAKTTAGALGIAGILGVGYICIVPLINVCILSLCFKLSAAVIAAVTEKRVSAVINEFSENIGRLALILLSTTVMFAISLAILCGFGVR